MPSGHGTVYGLGRPISESGVSSVQERTVIDHVSAICARTSRLRSLWELQDVTKARINMMDLIRMMVHVWKIRFKQDVFLGGKCLEVVFRITAAIGVEVMAAF